MEDSRGWWALLGPVPTELPAGIIAVPHDRAAVLDGQYQLGPISIRPGGRLLTEYLRSEPGQLAGAIQFETWPVIAEGSWPGTDLEPGGLYEQVATLRDQDPNKRVAAMWLHRAACLLSLAFGEAWQVRTAATEAERLPPEVPADWPAPQIALGVGGYDLDPVPRGVPDWVVTAWERLENDNDLAAALTTWHQGILLNSVFPSFALIAFCGAIEAVSESQIFRDRIAINVDPCPECGNVPKAHARFWATVGLVRPEEDIAALRQGRNPYSSRSSTAHGTATHGVETIYGYSHLLVYTPPGADAPARVSMDDNDDTQRFMWTEVPVIRAVAADLLVKALSEPA